MAIKLPEGSLKSTEMMGTLFFKYMDSALNAKRNNTKMAWTNIPTPLELFFANDVIPLQPELISGILSAMEAQTQKVLTEAEKYISRDCCSFQRHVIGNYFLKGFPRDPDMIVSTIPNSCDAQGKSFELLNYYEKKPIIYLDFGAEEDKEGIQYVKNQLLNVADFIGKNSNYEEFNEEKFKEMVRLSNKCVDSYIEICNLRSSTNPPPMNSADGFGLDIFNFTNKGGNFNDCILFHEAILKELKERVARGEGIVDEDAIRIMWMFLPPLYNMQLFGDIFEQNNAVIVFNELFMISSHKIENHDLFEGLAKKHIRNIFNGSIEKRVKMDLEAAKKYKIDAAVHFSIWGCRQSTSGAPSIQQAFQDEDIPLLILDGDCVDPTTCSPEQVKTRIEAFLEMLR